ncbi:pyridoxal phosphate-dependent aminotransferase [Halosquirtibacter laminarini]|uniref:Pyridoxal phosphate-dependent aminotransferase n=2 Tax=Halosquirtibacter laminarini TaxID=3374600 RepID=A0AC61NPJ0_9BACT|nr:pyridoxal phosphate-dependent aminotransferase [Prolixibacteraceae bacterium]
MAQKSRELKAQGLDIISLSVGEPDFDTPDFIKEAAKKAIDDNYSHYSPVNGYLELREAVVNKLKRDNQVEYSPDQILVSNGAKHSLANVVMSTVQEGDEVIIPAPYWVTYVELVKLAGGTNVVIPTTVENDFKITPEQLEAAITPKTRAFLFSSPSNPTGKLYTKEELSAFAAIFAKHPNIVVISDEIYEYINYEGKHESIAQFDAIKDQTVIVNGVSKAYAMTGYRIGYIAGPTWIVKACSKLQGQFTSGPNSVAQVASTAAIASDNKEVFEMVKAFAKRRDMMVEMMSEIPNLKISRPDGAFYVFPDVTAYFGTSTGDYKIETASDLCIYLLQEANVAIVTGEAFGDPNCVRLSYAAAEPELKEAVRRIKEAMSKLK